MNEIELIIKDLIRLLPKRQREVLSKRFGIKSQPLTLAAIGRQLGITRERVRQIEAAAFVSLKESAPSRLKNFVARVKDHLDDHGGARRHDLLLADIFKPELDSKVHFLLTLSDEVGRFRANDEWHDFWYRDESIKKKVFDYVKKLEEGLKNREDIGEPFKNTASANYISLSKKFGINVFGDFGLASWPEIRPRSVGDKAYLVLKNKKNPLHFRELTAEINRIKFDHKLANPQTVHNELIKDERFVLVGRGIYGLQEHGYQPGTAREVITRILKDKGAIHPNQIVELVKKERFLKENTISLSLQDKRYFRRLTDGRYTLV